MLKHKVNPRIIKDGVGARPDNFFYRLVSSQRFLAIIGLAFLVVIVFPLARTYSQRRLVEKEIEEVKEQIKDYENQNQSLKELISYLQSDQSLEAQARMNLNLKKPGEAVIVVEDKEMGPASISPVLADASSTNLAKWWRYFFN